MITVSLFMVRRLRWLVVILPVALAACGSDRSPAAPEKSAPGSGGTPAPGAHPVTGATVSAVDGAAAASTAFTVGGTLIGRSGENGAFSVGFPSAGVNRTVLNAAGFVTRETGVTAPAGGIQLSLIPSTFDLAAFDQMFRHSAAGLTRWTSAPAIVIERRVLQFTEVNAATYQALDETLTQADVDSVAGDMRAGYDILTAGRLGPPASVTSQEAAAGTAVTPRRDRTIVVTRQRGLTAATGFWGYARWSTTADGEVTSAVIMLDRDFEVSPSVFHRSLRMHELGHALGCQHISTGRLSVMNSNARTEPNDFDRQSARLASLRPIGNRTPDVDPASHSATTAGRTSQALVWHGAH